MKYRLFTPGPTPVPEEVLAALSRPIIHHRQGEFKEIFTRVNEHLKYLFQTKEEVITLTASGTGAMEAAVTNLLSAGDTALYVNGGKFGERWGQVLTRYGVIAHEIKVDWGSAVLPGAIKEMLRKHPEAKAIFFTHSETSTGTAIDLKAIAGIVRSSSPVLLIVDGVSSVGALELQMDEWGVDVVLTASQKGLMLPPGLSFIALSERAWKAARSSSLPKFYFDLEKALKMIVECQTPWTPAISLIVGLDVALQMIKKEDLRNVWLRHERLARGLREGCRALGLETFSTSPSNAITAVRMPEWLDGETLRRVLREKHLIVVAGGQYHLKGKVIRIAHLGHFDELDIVELIAALGLALQDCAQDSGAAAAKMFRERFDPSVGMHDVLWEFSKPAQVMFHLKYA